MDRATVLPPTELLNTLRAVETPEGITLDLRLAGPVPRALAWLIDSLIKYAVLLGILIGQLHPAEQIQRLAELSGLSREQVARAWQTAAVLNPREFLLVVQALQRIDQCL